MAQDFLEEFRRRSLRSHPFTVSTTYTTRATGGGSTTLEPPALIVANGAVGGGLRNQRAIIIEDNKTDRALGDNWPEFIYHVRGKLGPNHPGVADPELANAGIGIGHPWDDVDAHTRPPWPDPSSKAFVRVQYVFKTKKWELWSAAGDGVTPTEKVVFDDPFAMFAGVNPVWPMGLVELVYDPVNRAVYTILGGVERARITTLASLPRFQNEAVQNYSATGANIFVESGTVAGTAPTCFFCNFLCWNDDIDDPGATLWYS